ncbi:MAG TPA: hypothetical protein VHM91_00415 [Verrucomicrobiales bacterium]|jgi:hypothetical protein|nr:hypothetical protein [Verrucomicrobiales bacterium]
MKRISIMLLTAVSCAGAGALTHHLTETAAARRSPRKHGAVLLLRAGAPAFDPGLDPAKAMQQLARLAPENRIPGIKQRTS